MDIDALTQIDEARAIIDWAKGQRALGAGLRWAIREREGGALAGHAASTPSPSSAAGAARSPTTSAPAGRVEA